MNDIDDFDLAGNAYAQGIQIGRQRERHELIQHLAARADELDATWHPIERPTYEQRVAERIKEMERAAADWPQHSAAAIVRNLERDADVLRRAATGRFCPALKEIADRMVRAAEASRAALDAALSARETAA